jgi:hypothetical protein
VILEELLEEWPQVVAVAQAAVLIEAQHRPAQLI